MLLDTSGLLCLLHRAEEFHQLALSQYQTSVARRLVHNYVIAEFVTLADIRGLPRELVLRFARELERDSKIDTIWIDRSHHDEALALLSDRMDKSYSLCDAVSFVVMRRNGCSHALTTDHHFEQEGFVRLLV